MKNDDFAYILITLERPEDKPETMDNIDRIEKVEAFDSFDNLIMTFNELSYDGAEFPEGSDPCAYVAEKLHIPIDKIRIENF